MLFDKLLAPELTPGRMEAQRRTVDGDRREDWSCGALIVSPVGAERVTRPSSGLTLDAPSLQHATRTHAFGDRTQPVASPPLGQGALGDPTWARQFVGFLATYRRPQKAPALSPAGFLLSRRNIKGPSIP